MFDAQSDGLSSPLAFVSNLLPAALKTTRPCEAAPTGADATASMSHVQLSPSSTSSHITGESGDSDRSSWRYVSTPTSSDDGTPSTEEPVPVQVEERPRISFEELAGCYRQNHHKQARRKKLEQRLHATKVSIGISARLVRLGAAVQRGLVDRLKHDDKANFIALYHTMIDLQEPCSLAARRHLRQPDDWEDWPKSRESGLDKAPDFFRQLSPQSQADLLDILQSVRMDPQFVFEKLCSLTPMQLSALISSSVSSWEVGAESFPATSRSRVPSLGSKTVPGSGIPFKDRVLAFERTDPLSTLLFNVYAAPLDSEAPEAQLRLDTWSSICAKLIADGASRSFALLDHVLTLWATGSDWKAKPKFELYLMDILQTGAFLLEHIEPPPGYDMDPLDLLRTEVAEEYFASTVDALLELLDDPDAGLPRSVAQLSKAIIQKLDRQDCRHRFVDFLFGQWFFPKFLYGALTYPEGHDLLLDFYIRKNARDKLLGQVGYQAYTQALAVLRPMQPYPTARPTVRQHVEGMLDCITGDSINMDTTIPLAVPAVFSDEPSSPTVFLMLSNTDILTLLNSLFPCAPSPAYSSQSPSSVLSLSPLGSHPDKHGLSTFEPGFYRGTVPFSPRRALHTKSSFPTDIHFFSLQENNTSSKADRIRFELSGLGEHDTYNHLEPPSAEEWTLFTVSRDGLRLAWGLFLDSQPSALEDFPVDEGSPSTLGAEDNFEALQTAIVKLIQESHADDSAEYGLQLPRRTPQTGVISLKERFNRAMAYCHQKSDFIGAHYWWNATRLLRRSGRSATNSTTQLADDSWILEPMYSGCVRSLQTSSSVIERCEADFVALDRHTQQLQRTVKDMMKTMAKLRNKMWYMTDVRNSRRYEEAKHVALALKTMPYAHRYAQSDARYRGGARSFGGGLIQKPELQIMNVMKAPGSQAGPTKLADEQVDLIRKWLDHNNIDNFCKGEERIHRFCYEVGTSINRLVGETMAETPVLWASELFHKERAKYEGSSNRGFFGLTSSLRSFSGASDDSSHPASTFASTILRSPETPRQEAPQLNLKPSFQSLDSDRWRSPVCSTDTSSVLGDRAPSTTTGDSCSTFWSAAPPHTNYAPSASSLYSRPPSMLSDTVVQPPQRTDRKSNGKAAFLDDIRHTLTSLLLSDLGSPVWSCGTETDAWFSSVLDQKRIQAQMRKRSRIQRFYAQCDERASRPPISRVPSSRRSRSLDPPNREPTDVSSRDATDTNPPDLETSVPFSYSTVFRRLLDVFSRHGSPFVKLDALRDLRSLVIASITTANDDQCSSPLIESSPRQRRTSVIHRKRDARSSFSELHTHHGPGRDPLLTPTSPPAESIIFDSRPSDYSVPTEKQIVETLREIILDMKPKTLFRDLQFISAFVPSDTLNKSDSGTAFLQFGLAALSLKDEVCNSMVEIADEIVSQELTRRHLPHMYDMHHRAVDPLKDAANMWIITAKEGHSVAQRELAILYLTHPELVPRVTFPLTLLRDTFKAEMMYRRDKDSKSDPHTMCLALHWMQLSANGGDELARNRLREREEFESIA
ncbi:uncharacterized protein DSM5745_00465 [Aspergillus mulundensis]|uniref:Uncharacterized protein n=1 Tax=Aspergillus mulundensis TaxID=1810919 RepID=A0A3D8T3L7_9EURO|nr:Uncharacterized protein DSM5745_00465 [Aspergillus mulundensis]RDW93143.1 Uncharacterized protein DSM5745_00465 [Aspergillus mulundensis]